MAGRLYRASRLFIWFPAFIAILITFIPLSAEALTEPGLIRTAYNYRPNGYNQYNNAPPLPSITGIQPAGSETVTRVQDNFDQFPPFNLYEDFVISYKGYITSPVSGSFRFWPQGDDGTKLFINDILVQNDWRDKGGGGAVSSFVALEAGVSAQFEMWFYENGGGAWVNLYWDIGNGWEIVPDSAFTKQSVATTTTTTTIAPYFNPISNLQAEITNDGGVNLVWEQPLASNTDIYAYSITFFDIDNGEESGGWGIWTEQTSSSLGPWMWSGTTEYGDIRFKVKPGSAACFAPSQYPCIYGPDVVLDLFVSAPTTTTTSTTTTSSTTTTTVVVQSTQHAETTTTSQLETPQTSVVETTSTIAKPQTTLNQTTSTTQFLPETTTTSSTSSTIAQTTTTTSVPQNEDIELPKTISPEESVALATNPEILQSVTEDEAKQIFEAIDESSLTEEQAEQIIEAVQEAPTEVRETFEDTVDLFSGTFDSYEMVGQTISVGERRTIVAVNLVTATVAAVSATGGLGGGGGGGPSTSGGGGGPSDSNSAARKEDEEESEMSGEIAGDGVNWVGALSIYKIVNGEKKLNWKAFIKKFWFGVMNLGFTIAGSVVVYFTLSGKIQTIALVSTLLAFASAMYLHMKEPS